MVQIESESPLFPVILKKCSNGTKTVQYVFNKNERCRDIKYVNKVGMVLYNTGG